MRPARAPDKEAFARSAFSWVEAIILICFRGTRADVQVGVSILALDSARSIRLRTADWRTGYILYSTEKVDNCHRNFTFLS